MERMNPRQRVVLGVAAVVTVIMLPFPPWFWTEDTFNGWHFLARSSYVHGAGDSQNYTVAWDRLGLQLGAVAVAAGTLCLVATGRGKDGGA